MITLGDVRIHILSDGGFAIDGGIVFGAVPRTLWERIEPPDPVNRVGLGLNVLLIEAAGKRLLVETGIGDKWNEKRQRIFRLDRGTTLLDGLKSRGIAPSEIDYVINSHLHFDHAGGNTCREGDRVVPTFPNARYVVQLGEWEDATHPRERSRASYLEEDFVPLAEARRLETVQGEVEVVPGVRVAPLGGHTAYLQMVIVESGGRRLIVPSDVLPTTSHLPLPYITALDLYPAGTLEAKRRLLAEAAQQGWLVVFYHDQRRPLGRIEQENERYVFKEVTP